MEGTEVGICLCGSVFPENLRTFAWRNGDCWQGFQTGGLGGLLGIAEEALGWIHRDHAPCSDQQPTATESTSKSTLESLTNQ